MVSVAEKNMEKERCPAEGSIEKSGERPARCRHCNAEQIQICHWETGKAGGAMKQSQENCLSYIAV